MKNINTTFRLTAIATALLAAFGSAHAEDDEVRELSQPASSISVGAGYLSNDRLQQGAFDGLRDDGAYWLIDADVVKRNEETGTWLILKGQNLGLESRAVDAEVYRQGDVGASISYRRTPRLNPLQINTRTLGLGTENQRIGGTALHKVELGTYRDSVQVGFTKNLLQGLDLKFGFRNEEKNGERHWGLGSDPYFLAEPINSTTRQLDLTLEYTGERLQLAGGYSASWYINSDELVMGENRANANPGTSSRPRFTPLTLPLDNEAHQFFLNAGYSFTSSTRGTLKLSRSVATQDETLPTIGLSGPNAPFVGMPSSLDGEIVSTLVELGLTSRPTNDLSLSGNLRYYDVNDRTPLIGVVGSNTTGVATVHNTPHDYTTTSGKFEATYRLPQQFKLVAGVDLKNQDRSSPKNVDESERYVPYNEQIDETTYRLQLRRSMSDTVNGAIAFMRSERDGSSRVSPHEPELLTGGVKIYDMINPLHISDRTRDKVRVSVDWAPVEQFGVQLNVEGARDDYHAEDGRPYGLRSGRAMLVSLDARLAINDDWQVTGWMSHDKNRARQFNTRWSRELTSGAGSPQPPILEAYKDAALEDRGDSIGLGLRGLIGAALSVGADVQWTRSRSSFDEDVALTGNTGAQVTTTMYPTSSGVTGQSLDDIESTLVRVSMFAKYALRKNADLRFDVIHERWKTDDWTWSFANGNSFAYASPDGTTVAIKPKEVSNFIGARYIYKFQ